MAFSSVVGSRPHDLVEGLACVTLRVIRPIFAATHNATGPFPVFQWIVPAFYVIFGAVAGILASLLLKERAWGEVLVATDLEATLS